MPDTPLPTSRVVSSTGAHDDVARVQLAGVERDHIHVTIPGTSYRLRLACADAEGLRSRMGRRVQGRIAGRALRMHVTSAGGRFIEPADGMPRIVQGAVQVVDMTSRRVLVDMAVAVWIEPMPEQDLAGIAVGDLVNFYLESGTTFVPVT